MKKSAGLLFVFFLSIQVGCSEPVVVNNPPTNPEDGAGLTTAEPAPVYTILGTRTDNFDFGKAKSDAEDVLTRYPDIDCMVGFYSYNPPKIYEALQAAGRLGDITVIAFDEDPVTLGAVRNGEFAGTIVQDPYQWGYQGMKLMASYLEGDKSGIPEDGLIIVPTKAIDQSNVDAFEAELRERLGK